MSALCVVPAAASFLALGVRASSAVARAHSSCNAPEFHPVELAIADG